MKSDVETRLAALTRQIEEAEAVVADGGTSDLGKIDGEIERLCADVRTLPGEEGRALLPALEALLAGFDRLEAAMTSRFEGVKQELHAHGRRTQAVRAYGQQTPKSRRED